MEPNNTPISQKEADDMEKMILENQKILAENNKLLRKLQRGARWAFWLRLVWLAVFLGLPFIAYFYILAPYYEAIQETLKSFGIELPHSLFKNDVQ